MESPGKFEGPNMTLIIDTSPVPLPNLPRTSACPPQGKWTYDDYRRLPEDGLRYEIIEGAPDLAVEVLSPSTAPVDRGKKSQIYAQAGVREYWIVDPDGRTIELFVLRT